MEGDSDTLRNPLGRLLRFLDQLEEAHLHYDLKHSRDSVLVRVDLPTGFWEIEFSEEGHLEVEFFPRQKGVEQVGEEWLDRFIEENKD